MLYCPVRFLGRFLTERAHEESLSILPLADSMSLDFRKYTVAKQAIVSVLKKKDFQLSEGP